MRFTRCGSPMDERGVTLMETMIACLILLVGIAGVLTLFTAEVATTSSQGDYATRTAIYSQDKMEQLLALSFDDSSSDTTTNPTASTGGTGLGGILSGSTTVGGVNPASPVAGYVDYLDADAQQTTATGANYRRQWTITTNSAGNLKTITVLTTITTWAGRGRAPSAILVSAKSYNQ
jgi:Prokaryotic N-terminal methylation motif